MKLESLGVFLVSVLKTELAILLRDMWSGYYPGETKKCSLGIVHFQRRMGFCFFFFIKIHFNLVARIKWQKTFSPN